MVFYIKIYNITAKPLILCITACLLVLLFFIATLTSNKTIEMTNENYTQILKEVHENPYKYENKKVEMTGYIFRANDFNDQQIVVARDMLINESESRIVGFLCEYTSAKELKDNEWITAKGKIHIGDYHGPMPIIKLTKVKKTAVPEPIWVQPPTT